MTFEQKDNSGALFVNDKEGVEARPDRTGTAMINGIEVYVSGWLNTSKSGTQYLSLKFKNKEDKQVKETFLEVEVKDEQPLEDEIPF